MKRLRKEREARMWSKAELARQANMNSATVGQIENGVLRPYPVQLNKLATALGWRCAPEDLMDEVD
jgi:ribosome-binding protein aMBF1 (putative translation factor)